MGPFLSLLIALAMSLALLSYVMVTAPSLGGLPSSVLSKLKSTVQMTVVDLHPLTPAFQQALR